jgi:DNA-binding IclR family transcriptional regulator
MARAKLVPVPQNLPAPTAEGTGTVHRVVHLLSAIADSGGSATISSFAETLSLPNSTVHRLLHLLRKEGVVEWHPENHRYAAGPELFRMAARIVASMDISGLAQPYLEKLVQIFNETVLLGLYLPGRKAMSFAARADGSLMLQYRVALHQPLSLVWGASGKAILAFLPDDVVAEVAASEGRAPASGALPLGREALMAELTKIRATGYAVTDGEKLAGARGIAAPVFSHAGIVGCLCMTSPKHHIADEAVPEIGRQVAANAAALSWVLGAVPGATERETGSRARRRS